MKNKIRILINVLTAISITAGYATCYLDQIVLCVSSGQNLGGFSSSYKGTAITSTAYANENAFRNDTYTVTTAGFNELSLTPTYCEGIAESVSGTSQFAMDTSGYFQVYYFVSSLGADVDDYNPSSVNGYLSPNVTFYSVVTHYTTTVHCP